MKTLTGLMISALVVMGLVSGCTGMGAGAGAGAGASSGMEPDRTGGEEVGETSEGLAADLRYLREEEKLARDVYMRLGDAWGLRVFENIARSEQQHTDTVKALLAARGIADPVSDDTVGVFEDEVLRGLYETLVEQGLQSEGEALKVGAMIEELDIQDISDLEARTEEADVLSVYQSLKCGSHNHMRAFSRQLDQRDLSYAVQYITEDEYATILAGEQGACP